MIRPIWRIVRRSDLLERVNLWSSARWIMVGTWWSVWQIVRFWIFPRFLGYLGFRKLLGGYVMDKVLIDENTSGPAQPDSHVRIPILSIELVIFPLIRQCIVLTGILLGAIMPWAGSQDNIGVWSKPNKACLPLIIHRTFATSSLPWVMAWIKNSSVSTRVKQVFDGF